MVELKELKPRDLTVVRNELNKISADGEGLLTADSVVDSASPPGSPLHDYFDWNDSTAGHKYRLQQARELIRRIEVVMPDDKDEKMVPKYVSLRSDRRKPGGGYRETKTVLNSKEMLAELEDTAKRDIEGVLSRYELLKELCSKVRKAAGINGRKKK